MRWKAASSRPGLGGLDRLVAEEQPARVQAQAAERRRGRQCEHLRRAPAGPSRQQCACAERHDHGRGDGQGLRGDVGRLGPVRAPPDQHAGGDRRRQQQRAPLPGPDHSVGQDQQGKRRQLTGVEGVRGKLAEIRAEPDTEALVRGQGVDQVPVRSGGDGAVLGGGDPHLAKEADRLPGDRQRHDQEQHHRTDEPRRGRGHADPRQTVDHRGRSTCGLGHDPDHARQREPDQPHVAVAVERAGDQHDGRHDQPYPSDRPRLRPPWGDLVEEHHEREQERSQDRLLERRLPVVGGEQVRERARDPDHDAAPRSFVRHHPGCHDRGDRDDRDDHRGEREVESHATPGSHSVGEAVGPEGVAARRRPQEVHQPRAQGLCPEQVVGGVVVEADADQPDAAAGQEWQRGADERDAGDYQLVPVEAQPAAPDQEGQGDDGRHRPHDGRGDRAAGELDRDALDDDQRRQADRRRGPGALIVEPAGTDRPSHEDRRQQERHHASVYLDEHQNGSASVGADR